MVIAILFMNFGILSFAEKHSYYGQSNLVHLRFMQILVIPCGIYYIFQLLIFSFEPNEIFGVASLVFGLLGVMFSITRLFMELFQLNAKESQNLFKIMGYTYEIRINMIWIFISFYHLFSNYDLSLYTSFLFLFLIILISSTMMLWEAVNPLIFYDKGRNIRTFADIGILFPNFLILFVFTLFYNIGPGFPGFYHFKDYLILISTGVSTLTLLSNLKWIFFALYLLFQLILPIALGTLLVNVYKMPKSSGDTKKKIDVKIPVLKEYIFAPIFLIGLIILQIIFASSITELDTFFI